jgi:uncharacterized protein
VVDIPPINRATLHRLLNATLSRATHQNSMLHGEAHWRAVAWTYLELLPEVAGADPVVGVLFGLLHDSQRLDDGFDPQHGPRASRFAEELAAENLLPLGQERKVKLIRVVHDHTGARPTADPTIGLCFDSDRLNLWRIGVRPEPSHLSTAIAKAAGVIERHESLPGQKIPWDEIFSRCLARVSLASGPSLPARCSTKSPAASPGPGARRRKSE